jgi:hypothetical protein
LPHAIIYKHDAYEMFSDLFDAVTPRVLLRCPLRTPTIQVIEWMLLDVVTPIEDIVLVEHASNDEEVV